MVTFGLPARTATAFQVPVRGAPPMGLRLRMDSAGALLVDWSAQPAFDALRNMVLTELAKDRALFRSPPTAASLQAIAPIWGFVRGDGDEPDRSSPYMTVQLSATGRSECVVDLQLVSLEISRSTIRPTFIAVPVDDRIDIDWETGGNAALAGNATPGPFVGSAETDELEEVSDVAAEATGVIRLADPAVKAREKAAAKARVRAAFEAAETARAEAEAAAAAFLDAYDLSDSESAFSEWLSESEDE